MFKLFTVKRVSARGLLRYCIVALGAAGLLLPQMLAFQTDFLSVMAAGLVNRLGTGMSKILYLLVCWFLRL